MTLSIKDFEEAALKLPAGQRAALAERLIASLDTLDDAEAERLWVEEAERRFRAYKEGRLSARPASEAIQDAMARLR